MRIIAGSARGRPLRAPPGLGTRPILDLQKESLFNVLREDLPCGGVLDLFAGSGSLGLEALSRGAGSATFVERDRRAAGILRANIEACGFEGVSKLVIRDVFALEAARIVHPVDLVFCDPPFPLWQERGARLSAYLGSFLAALPGGGPSLLMLRIPAGGGDPPGIPAFGLADRRESGESLILIYRRPAAPA